MSSILQFPPEIRERIRAKRAQIEGAKKAAENARSKALGRNLTIEGGVARLKEELAKIIQEGKNYGRYARNTGIPPAQTEGESNE